MSALVIRISKIDGTTVTREGASKKLYVFKSYRRKLRGGIRLSAGSAMPPSAKFKTYGRGHVIAITLQKLHQDWIYTAQHGISSITFQPRVKFRRVIPSMLVYFRFNIRNEVYWTYFSNKDSGCLDSCQCHVIETKTVWISDRKSANHSNFAPNAKLLAI